MTVQTTPMTVTITLDAAEWRASRVTHWMAQ